MLVIGAAFPGEGWKDKAVLKEQERMRVNRWYGVEQHAGSGSVYGGGGGCGCVWTPDLREH